MENKRLEMLIKTALIILDDLDGYNFNLSKKSQNALNYDGCDNDIGGLIEDLLNEAGIEDLY